MKLSVCNSLKSWIRLKLLVLFDNIKFCHSKYKIALFFFKFNEENFYSVFTKNGKLHLMYFFGILTILISLHFAIALKP